MTDYNVQFPDGTPLVIQTGTINNTYDIPLVGQDAINYGDDFATAYIRLLSNFAYTSAPSFGTTRTAGQLWYDTTPSTGGLNIFDGTSWDAVPIDSTVVHIAGAELITGLKTFSAAPDFTAAGEPFTVNSTTTVANLSAATLDGNASTAFATSLQGATADAAEPDLLLPASSGWILSSTTGGARSWISPTAGSGQVEPVDVTDGSIGDLTIMNVLLVDVPTGSQNSATDAGGLTYNGSTNVLTSAGGFVGALLGNASSATLATTATEATVGLAVRVADESADTSCNVLFTTAATGDLATKSGTNLTFNSNSGLLTATTFSGSGASLTNINTANIVGTPLAIAQGGTNVSTSTGSGTAFVLHNSPTFVTKIFVDAIDGVGSNVELQFDGVHKFRTTDETVADNTSGAEVKDGSGTYRNVGFNDMITTSLAASGNQDFTRAAAGHSWRATHSSGIRTFTAEATDTDIPNGAIWNVRNLSTSTGTVVIDSGASSTVRHYDGSGGTPPESVNGANTFTLARGGVATLVKVADAEYELWGIGLTGGA